MTGKAFEAKWLKTFVPGLTQDQYDDCYINEYLWHVFSYEIVPKDRVCCGDAAREAYRSADKADAITICLWSDPDRAETAPLPAALCDPKQVDRQRECYIVSRDWTWTYVSTHENDWLGPYFFRIP